MTEDKQERIRQRALELWEQAGRPEGEHEQHWHQATREIEDEDALAGGSPTRDVDVNERRGEYEKSGPFGESADPRSYRREDEPNASVIVPPLPR